MYKKEFSTFIKPLGLIISSGISFILALVAFIITAVSSTYDDGYGVSYSYGRKDLLVLTLSSLIILLLGIILLINVIRKRKTGDLISPLFVLSSSTIISFFMLGQILKPAISGEAEMNANYIVNIVAMCIAFVAFGFGVVIIINTVMKKHAYLTLIFFYVAMLAYSLSIIIYAVNQGIALISNNLPVSILFILIAIFQLFELFPLLYGMSDHRRR